MPNFTLQSKPQAKMVCEHGHWFAVADPESAMRCPMCLTNKIKEKSKCFVRPATNMHGDPLCSSCGCGLMGGKGNWYCGNPDC